MKHLTVDRAEVQVPKKTHVFFSSKKSNWQKWPELLVMTHCTANVCVFRELDGEASVEKHLYLYLVETHIDERSVEMCFQTWIQIWIFWIRWKPILNLFCEIKMKWNEARPKKYSNNRIYRLCLTRENCFQIKLKKETLLSPGILSFLHTVSSPYSARHKP